MANDTDAVLIFLFGNKAAIVQGSKKGQLEQRLVDPRRRLIRGSLQV